jgi:hypothetical protein
VGQTTPKNNTDALFAENSDPVRTRNSGGEPPSATPDTTVPATSEPPSVAAPPSVSPANERATEMVGFTSPSGNVGCMLNPGYARCDIAERDWTPPPRPSDCEFDYGQGIALSPGEQPTFVCAGDTALGGGEPLAFGRSVRAGPFQCVGADSGITCRDTKSGRGFTIARERHRIF